MSLFSLLILNSIVLKQNLNAHDLFNMLIWKPYWGWPFTKMFLTLLLQNKNKNKTKTNFQLLSSNFIWLSSSQSYCDVVQRMSTMKITFLQKGLIKFHVCLSICLKFHQVGMIMWLTECQNRMTTHSPHNKTQVWYVI